ncbi:YopX family protein [Bacillus atrophaeus]|uniref:YopX family protein n=1 Tax=Bacillus atrophaeus TaxID=1452 RepID=UPI002E23A823|nr:YopX family protein [Bacillus atrophaeus]
MNTAYRVWDGDGRMYYWNDLGLSLELKGDKWILWHTWGDGSRAIVIESDDKDADLMWGTGLEDKNEKMIYEYDIDMIDNEPMVVAYIDGQWGLKFPNDPTHFEDCIDWGECDIGGNVYQNPELLEGVE